ncbi:MULTISPECIES: Lrp/AsnC family transcriptional regulator [Azospirillaceae]|uniref:Lrp/AsnC family transcriptional regulator n=1 Tax=Azospirillaceae TaxID=2829815 RepID=UPI000B6BDD27|nr:MULTISPECIES: Lrp/AsnC family transcriptional regulator [Azospirillaceae]MDG5496595.1 Lrp/AsnC family transcriptional regulator [Niveispirillum sp. BGYR6]SNS46877.1 transcriptional regulator, AsnC family [Azospirillum sp. RU38E]SNS66040.1 transcriptional regulator, AsnC family [Azospirillum sp. RU37A]
MSPSRRRLDQIDQRILMALQQDGRITNQALSEKVGLSPRPCLERVRRLEREGLIRRYQAVLDIRRLQSCITVLAQIAMERHGRESRQLFERRLANTPEVVECFEVSGAFDYVAKLICPDIDAYQELTQSWIDDSELGVVRVTSNIVLRPVRDMAPIPLFGQEE